jgi:hypothetical protein
LRDAANLLYRVAVAGNKRGKKRTKPEWMDELFPKDSPACDIDWENYKEDDEPDSVLYANAAEYQLYEARRMALEFGLLRRGAQPQQITETVLQGVDQVIQAWRELRTKLQTIGTLDEASK